MENDAQTAAPAAVVVITAVVAAVMSVSVAPSAVAVSVLVAAACGAAATRAVSAADAAVAAVGLFNNVGLADINGCISKWHSISGRGDECESCTNGSGCDECCYIHDFSSSSLLVSLITGSAYGAYHALHEPNMNV